MKISLPILFALGTALCWGLYGPTLANARSPEKLYSAFKPYVGIGLAYIVWAFLGGMIAMLMQGDNFSLAGKQQAAGTWGFAAGTLGALGALSLTTAMMKGGGTMPHVVMSVVFGGAVTITAIVSIVSSGSEAKTSPWLWIGIVGTFFSILLVAYNTPHGGPHKPKPSGNPDTHAAAPAEK